MLSGQEWKARNWARAPINWIPQGQRWGRCNVRRRAERVIRPPRARTRRLRVLVARVRSLRPIRAVHPVWDGPSVCRGYGHDDLVFCVGDSSSADFFSFRPSTHNTGTSPFVGGPLQSGFLLDYSCVSCPLLLRPLAPSDRTADSLAGQFPRINSEPLTSACFPISYFLQSGT